MMSCCHHYDSCCDWNHSYCPYPQWKHPLLCNLAHWCSANSDNDNGPTLVIHQILLEPCGNQSCTPRNFTIRITGPSYPCGETFTLRAGSCTELDEPLVITNLEPGQYEIDLITAGGCGCGCTANTTRRSPVRSPAAACPSPLPACRQSSPSSAASASRAAAAAAVTAAAAGIMAATMAAAGTITGTMAAAAES